MRRYVLLLSAMCAVAVFAGDVDVLHAKLSRSIDGITVGSGACPGCVVADGVHAAPIAFGRVNGTEVAVAAAASHGKGRVVSVTHQSFFDGETGRRSDNATFLRECLLWLAGNATTKTVYIDERRRGMAANAESALKGSGVIFKTFRSYGELAAMPSGAVVVTMPDGYKISEAAKLTEFIKRGGGVFAIVVGWGWQQLNPGKSFSTDSTFNAALGPAGIYTGGNIADATRNSLFEIAKAVADVPGCTAKSAMDFLAGGGKATKNIGERSLFTLGMLDAALPPKDIMWRPKLDAFRNSAGGIVPSPAKPLGANRVRERLAYVLFQNAWQSNLERNWPANAAASVYPGVPEKGTSRVTRDVTVDLSIPRWHSTGLFAAAGEPLTVTLPEGAEKMGLRIRVGSTTCRLTSAREWRRAPIVDMEMPISKRSVTFASPFGGLVYVVVPRDMKGKVTVKIGPACPAPRFVEGRDTPESWAGQLRCNPAPFAEIENDHIVLIMPYDSVKDLADPRPLLQVWREIMDNDARLAAIPIKRDSPERICIDVQLCAGYMHSGYPIMIPAGSARRLASEPIIRAGEQDDVWGFFHEMGHNHQHPDWTFNGTGEVTVNFFTLYNMLKICGRTTAQTKLGDPNIKRNFEAWDAAGRPVDKWFADPFLALYFFARFADKYGWDAFRKLFAEYRALPPGEHPKTDLEKRRQWATRLSRIVGEDLTPEFQFLLKK